MYFAGIFVSFSKHPHSTGQELQPYRTQTADKNLAVGWLEGLSSRYDIRKAQGTTSTPARNLFHEGTGQRIPCKTALGD